MIFQKLRDAGFKVEAHHIHFKHNTPDEVWLEVAGEKKWIVLTRDKMIGKRMLQLDALLSAGVRAFVLVTYDLTDAQNAEIIIRLTDKILAVINENKFPFVAKIRQDDVVIWKVNQPILKGLKRKRRK